MVLSTLTKHQLDEQPRHPTCREKLSQRLSRNKKWWIGGTVAVTVLILIIVIVAATVRDKGSSHVWKDKSIRTQLETVNHVEFCGTWDDRLVVAGATMDGKSSVEIFDLDEGKNWQSTDIFVVQNYIESMAVSVSGKRIALAVSDVEGNVRFLLFEETEGGTWNQYGQDIAAEELLESSDYSSVSAFTSPSVQLSSNGRIMVLTLQPADASQNLEQSIHVLQDVNSLGGIIGQVWKRLGEPIVNKHTEDHGAFGTFVALSGAGDKLVIAASFRLLAVYELQGEEWQLQAEYDESPVVGKGSLALSRDGSTLAVGSYDSSLQGTGELYIMNNVWPWFLVDDDQDKTTTTYDSSTSSLEISLSETGDHVLVGRFYTSGDALLEVYMYDAKEHDWVSMGGPFGKVPSSEKGAVDISGDALRVVAALDGQLLVFEFSS